MTSFLTGFLALYTVFVVAVTSPLWLPMLFSYLEERERTKRQKIRAQTGDAA